MEWADNTLQKTLELVGDYTKSFGVHNMGIMAGYSYQDDDDKGIYQWAKDFPDRYVWSLEYRFNE